MMFSPVGILVRGVVSLLVLVAGVSLAAYWASLLPDAPAVDVRPVPAPPARTPPTGERDGPDAEVVPRPAGDGPGVSRPSSFFDRLAAWRPGLDSTTAVLAVSLLPLVFAFAGRLFFLRVWLPLFLPRDDNDPTPARGGEVVKLRKPDGTTLHVELFGPPDAPPVVLTHGWGADGTEWFYLKRDLAANYRLIVWDLPGLGLSDPPADDDYALDNLARDLRLVLGLAGGRPAVLVGHSIGGMTSLTFCKLFPADLGPRVSGLVLVHTTHTNPVFTKKPTWLLPRVQKPVLEPLCHVIIGLSPVVRGLLWLSYLNGSAHRANHGDLFAGTESPEQLEFVTRFLVKASPAVLARGTLAMFRYDASAVLPAVTVPTLVVAADLDVTTVPDASRHMAATIPGAELATLAPARHVGLIERHAEFSRLVAAFLARHAG